MGTGEDDVSGAIGVWANLSSLTFSMKNILKFSQREADGTIGEESRGFMRELKVLKSTWGLWQFFKTRLEIKEDLAALTARW